MKSYFGTWFILLTQIIYGWQSVFESETSMICMFEFFKNDRCSFSLISQFGAFSCVHFGFHDIIMSKTKRETFE